MLPEPLFNNLSPLNPVIVILEYAHAIRKEKMYWWNNLVIQYIQVVSWPILWAHNMIIHAVIIQWEDLTYVLS